jgi:predicted enzyme related to lactoylglutathione lyase
MIFAGETPDTMLGDYALLARDDARGSRWVASVSVDDVDVAVATARANGGAVLDAPRDIPNVGRGARIADPTGAELSLFKSATGDKPDEDAPLGTFFWNELHTTDSKAALEFYAKTVGYSHETMPGGGGDAYHVVSRGGVGRGGVTTHLSPGAQPHWLPYVRVDDVDASAARAERLGGAIVVKPTDIPAIGRFTVIRDPGGAALALMKPNPRMPH